MSTSLPAPIAIFLDMDDTIVDDTGSVDRCWPAACDHYTPHLAPYTSEQINLAIRRHAQWFWSDANRHRQGQLALEAARREIGR